MYDAALGVSLSEMHFTDANIGYVCGSKGTIAKTTDGGITWTDLNSGSTTAVFQGIHFFNANSGVAVGLGGIASFTNDGGATWCTQTISSQHLRDVRMLSANSAIIIGENGTILKNTNIACTLGVDETSKQPEISIFPMPLNDVLNITATGLESVVLYNAAGEIVKTMTADSDSIMIDCSQLPAGLYIVHVSTAMGIEMKKVIKQ